MIQWTSLTPFNLTENAYSRSLQGESEKVRALKATSTSPRRKKESSTVISTIFSRDDE
jgi:hypothetical protein